MKAPTLAATAAILFCSQTLAEPVNINTADASSIASALDGIGQRKAMAIVDYRQQHGPFLTPDDIVLVRGIGQSTLEKNKADILVK
jgi:competence protein ComEA